MFEITSNKNIRGVSHHHHLVSYATDCTRPWCQSGSSYTTELLCLLNTENFSCLVMAQRKKEMLPENITLIAYLCLDFHVSLNSRNTKLANSWDHWESIDI